MLMSGFVRQSHDSNQLELGFVDGFPGDRSRSEPANFISPVFMRETIVSLAEPEGGAEPRPEGQQAAPTVLPMGTFNQPVQLTKPRSLYIHLLDVIINV